MKLDYDNTTIIPEEEIQHYLDKYNVIEYLPVFPGYE